MGQRIAIGSVHDVPDGESVVATIGQKDVAIFRVKDQFYAIDDLCPHMGASLSGGFVEDGVVTCPWHYWRFKLCDGTWADNPKIKTGCYKVHVVNERIEIEAPDAG